MKLSDIKKGTYYSDSKSGLREVVDIGPQVLEGRRITPQPGVCYRVHATKNKGNVGKLETMTLSAFASWAKQELSSEEAELFKLAGEAEKLATKLTPTQREFLKSIDSDATVESQIECNRNELRVAKGCCAKGIVAEVPAVKKDDLSFEVSLTPIGISVLRCVHEEE
ncbi:hypothetical protein [Geopseudomonas aromaticivorans]